jgi:hypothetical protein
MAKQGTSVPKRELVGLILRSIPQRQIRFSLNVQPGTDLQRRLEDFKKSKLVELLESTEKGKSALKEAEADYPLYSPPTLYLITVQSWPDREELIQITSHLGDQGREGGIWFGDDKTVRRVYTITPAREVQSNPDFFEVPLLYEKRIEYTNCEPESDEYGEIQVVHSLEKAFAWLNEKFNHAILACGDFAAVKPVLYYGRVRLRMSWHLPNLSEEMLKKLGRGGRPRTATFSRLEQDESDVLDVQTLTVSDPELGESRGYQAIESNPVRHQTSGFYSTHPDLVYGGLGIARRYGRIWTPARLKKDNLLALSVSLIKKTEAELTEEAERNLEGYLGYFRNIPISINRRKITTAQRNLLDELIKTIIRAGRSQNQEAEIPLDTTYELLEHADKLCLTAGLEAHCPNCGDYLVRCPICQQPFESDFEDDSLLFRCPDDQDQLLRDDARFTCECGEELEVTFSSDIRIYPQFELIQAIRGFMTNLENQQLEGVFLIIGNILRLLTRQPPGAIQYLLQDLRAWRMRARLHVRNVPENRAQNYTGLLSGIKEKCSRNNGHPSGETCRACMDEAITRTRMQARSEICLPRLFGFVIDEQFDGVHHGHEKADVIYTDVLDQDGDELRIGIHMKSRNNPRKHGLGRSVGAIKGLFTQYCYSAYQSAMGELDLNVIGISVPNTIHADVIRSMEYLGRELGFPLIVVDEGEWVKILDAAMERSEVEFG